MLVTKQMTVAIDVHIMEKKYYGSQWLPLTVWLPTFFKISSLCSAEKKKLKQVWNDMRVSKSGQDFILGELTL